MIVLLNQLIPKEGYKINELKLMRLQLSLNDNGQLEPITIEPSSLGKQYIIVDGHLRAFALAELGHKTVEATLCQCGT